MEDLGGVLLFIELTHFKPFLMFNLILKIIKKSYNQANQGQTFFSPIILFMVQNLIIMNSFEL